MILALPFILGAILVAVMTHLAATLMIPHLAGNDVHARLLPVTPVNAAVPVAHSQLSGLKIPFVDPAFAVAACRYDLAAGVLRVRASASDVLMTVVIVEKGGSVSYSLSDRAAAGDAEGIDVVLGTPEQIARIENADPEDEAVSELRVRAGKREGVVFFKVYASADSLRETAEQAAASCTCAIEGLESADAKK